MRNAKPQGTGSHTASINAAESMRGDIVDARYQALLGALNEFVLLCSPTGRIECFPESWCSYTGHDLDGLRRFGWLKAIHPEDRADTKSAWADGLAQRNTFELSVRLWNSPSRTFRHCNMRVVPVFDADQTLHEWLAAVADVEDERQALIRQKLVADQFRRVFDANLFGIAYGVRGRIYDANEAFLAMVRAPRSALVDGLDLRAMFVQSTPSDRTEFTQGAPAREVEVRCIDGTSAFLHMAAVSMAPERGWIAVAVDMTDRRAAEFQQVELALHDPLTGLANRRLLESELQRSLARTQRKLGCIATLFCDLDNFKTVNDTYGHRTGDAVLRAASQRIASALRNEETLARTGGDEFVVVLEDLQKLSDVLHVAERIRLALRDPIVENGHQISVTASVGVAFCDGPPYNAERLLDRADEAMYRAKHAGRDRIRCA